MSESKDAAGSEGNGAAIDPVAVALALDGASRETADAFLNDQRALIADQRRHLHEQEKQIHLDIAEKWLGVFLRLATAVVGIALAGFASVMVWDAAHSNNLVIDSFAVPPELSARGLSGSVVAAKLSDKIADIQAATVSLRPPKSYANGVTEGLRLEIPETGVSLSELDRFLHAKLGRDLHIGGEIVQTDTGVALTARVGSDGSATVTDAQAGMDASLQKLAEQVYRITQPYRYAVWAQAHGRIEEGIAILRELAVTGPDNERAWAYIGLAIAAGQFQSGSEGRALAQRSQALDPDNYIHAAYIATQEERFGHAQEAARNYGAALNLLLAHGGDYTLPGDRITAEHVYRALFLLPQGALQEAAEQGRAAVAAGIGIGSIPTSVLLAEIRAALHEPGAARALLVEKPNDASNNPNRGARLIRALRTNAFVALEAQDWPALLASEETLPQIIAQYPGLAEARPILFDPMAALALAHMGQFAAAEARLKTAPADCYPCARARGQVAALQKQNARADFWFDAAIKSAPAIPFAYSEWGEALLERGQPDAAIEKFKLANKKSPHFADPLEGWGEALMARNQSHRALAKFAEAGKYAPNWGRLHLKWGEALVHSGKPEQAKAQFAHAAQLDLTPAEKAELARFGNG